MCVTITTTHRLQATYTFAEPQILNSNIAISRCVDHSVGSLLEMAAEWMEDELKQIASVGRVRKIGNVNEELDLLLAVPVLNGSKFSGDEIMDAISTRIAMIAGGTFRAEGHNFPVDEDRLRTRIDLKGRP